MKLSEFIEQLGNDAMDFELKFVENFRQEGVAFHSIVEGSICIDDIGHSDKVIHIGCDAVHDELQRMQDEIDKLKKEKWALQELSLQKADEDQAKRGSQGIFG